MRSKMDQTKALAEVEGALPVQLTIWTLAEQQTAHNLFRKVTTLSLALTASLMNCLPVRSQGQWL